MLQTFGLVMRCRSARRAVVAISVVLAMVAQLLFFAAPSRAATPTGARLHQGVPAVADAAQLPEGYRAVGSDGGLFDYGADHYLGNAYTAGVAPLRSPIVGMAPTFDGKGYWFADADGTVYHFGDARALGSVSARSLRAPIVGIAATPDGHGYWLVSAVGQVFHFGNAGAHGSLPDKRPASPIVGIASSTDGGGYWLASADAEVFHFGDARSLTPDGGEDAARPVVGITSTFAGSGATDPQPGYWLTTSFGQVSAFGSATYLGSLPPHNSKVRAVGITPTTDDKGYWVATADGTVRGFGTARFLGDFHTDVAEGRIKPPLRGPWVGVTSISPSALTHPVVPPVLRLSYGSDTVHREDVGHRATLEVHVTVDGRNDPKVAVSVAVSGPNLRVLPATTDAAGIATVHYTGATAGTDTIIASVGPDLSSQVSNTVSIVWTGSTVLNGATLTLAPATAGPDVVGTPQTLVATLLDSRHDPIASTAVSLEVAGANSQTLSGTTVADGEATFTYTGAAAGTDTLQASVAATGKTLVSGTSSVSWVTPVAPASTTEVTGRFFDDPQVACDFEATPADTPVFSEKFPTIDFNPPSGTIPNTPPNYAINDSTEPFTDVTTDPLGNYEGTEVAEGADPSGVLSQAGNDGPNDIPSFYAEFTGELVVSKPGDQTFNIFSNDGWILGIGNGATQVSGTDTNPPASGVTPFMSYPVVGAFNDPDSGSANPTTVDFPAAGVYPYEADYTQCDFPGAAFTIADSASEGLPSAGTLTVTPSAPAPVEVGTAETFTASALDASGQAVAGLPVSLSVTGANPATLTGSTDRRGLATFTYTGTDQGVDQVQAGANISGSPEVSNAADVQWDPAPAGPPAAISATSPPDGTWVTQPVPVTGTIRPPTGQTITGWSVTVTSSAPGAPTSTLATGTGTPPPTLATLDPTILDNGTYNLTITAMASGGGTGTSTSTVVVAGDTKLGRFTQTYQDLATTVAGLPVDVDRTYDSFDPTSGDFGIGWNVGVSDIRVETGRPLGAGGWSEYDTSCFVSCNAGWTSSLSHAVSVTWPDGREEMWNFTPTGGSIGGLGFGSASYTAVAGTDTTDTLSPMPNDSGTVYDGDGNLYTDLSLDTVYDPTQFQLTTRSGTVYVLDVDHGLVSSTDPSGNTLTYSADGIQSTLGPASDPTPGPSITFARDSDGRITSIEGPAGESISYGYDAAGDLTSVTNDVTTVHYSYDPTNGLLRQSTDADNQPITTVTYTASGRVATVAEGSSPPSAVTTSAADRSETVRDPDGALTTTYLYDAGGDLVEEDRAYGGTDRRTSYTYDSSGRRTGTILPSGAKTSTTYEEAPGPTEGDVLTQTDADGRTTTDSNYNSFGEPGTTTGPDGVVTELDTYDPQTGLTLTSQRPGLLPAVYTYDPDGTLASETDAAGRTTTYTYDGNGNQLTEADSRGDTTTTVRDAAGQVTEQIDPLGNRTDYTYDANGNVTSVVDESTGATETETYNDLDEPLENTDADGGTTTYTYDPSGHLLTKVDPDGITTTDTYDADGNLLSERSPSVDDRFTYDPTDDLVSATDAAEETDLGYDADGNLVSQEECPPQPGGRACPAGSGTTSIVDSVDPTGAITSIGGPGGAVGYTYDADGDLSRVTDPRGGAFDVTYDPQGRPTSMSRPNGVRDSYTWDADDEVTSWTAATAKTTLAEERYTLDPATGEVTSSTDLTGTSNDTYDADGELLSASHPTASGLPPETYTYDSNGNRLSGPTASTSYTYDKADRLLTTTGETYRWNHDGDLVSATGASGTTTYSWDSNNRLLRGTGPAGTTSYAYDAFGRRIATETGGAKTTYAWLGANLLDSVTAGATTSYVSEPPTASTPTQVLEVSKAGTASYPLIDPHGDWINTSTAAGTVTAPDAEYSTFGVAAHPVTTAEGYDSYTPGAAGDFAYNRYYDPSIGRFISPDPLYAPNAYIYGLDSPESNSDPNGALPLRQIILASYFLVWAIFQSGTNAAGDEFPLDGLSDAAEEYYRDIIESEAPDLAEEVEARLVIQIREVEVIFIIEG